MAIVFGENNLIKGYCLGRPGHNFTQIGPIVAADIDIAKMLVSAAIVNCDGQEVILDATDVEAVWWNWLLSVGFVEQRQFIRMFRGTNRFEGLPANQYAILGPEFG